MKKQLLNLMICICILSGCAGGVVLHRHSKQDDAISKTMVEMVGEDFWYIGKEVLPDEAIKYGFLIRHNDVDILEKLVDCCSSLEISKENRIIISVYEESSNGVYDTLFYMSNYDCWGETEGVSLDYFGYLKIQHDVYAFDIWHDPETYKVFENVIYLEIPDVLQLKAEEAEIDWYEIWPELEDVEVIETGFLN